MLAQLLSGPTLPWTELGCPETWVFLIKSPEGGFSVTPD